MATHLSQQAERICDESGKGALSVIVQTRGVDDESADILAAARHAIERRSQTISARDLLPPVAKDLERKRITTSAKKKLNASGQSMAAMMTMHSVTATSRKAIEAAGRKSIGSVIRLEAVRCVIAATRKTDRPASFLASGSFVLEVKNKDDLAQLAKDEALSNAVSDIYPNRSIEIPSPSDVKNLPGAVSAAENEISTWGLQKTNALACWGAFGAKGAGVKVAVLASTRPTPR